jgi:hypothetical protein
MTEQTAQLDRIEQRLDRLEAVLMRLEQRTQLLDQTAQLPHALATVTDSIDHLMREAQLRGFAAEERLPRLLELAEQLTRPERLTALIAAVQAAEQAPAFIATAVDMLDGAMQRWTARGHDPLDMLKNISDTVELLSRTLESPEFKTLMSSGVLDPASIQVVARAARALVDASAHVEPSGGVFSTFFALRDRNIQRAVGFGLSFGRRFGQLLQPALTTEPRQP